jgi:predicted outer membrane protein
MMLTRVLHAPLILAAGGILSLWVVQDPAQPNPHTTKPPAQPQNQDPQVSDVAERSDRVLAAWLIVENNNEVALSKVALERSKNEEVKQFAQKMIDDHTAFAQRLREFAPGIGELDSMDDRTKATTPPPAGSTTEPTPTKPREDGTRRPLRDDDTRPVHGGGLDHIELIRDLGRKCLESSKLELNPKQDAEFDQCFVGMQLMAHQQAADMLEVFQRYASPNLRQTLDAGLQTVRAHKDQAKKLMESVASKRIGDPRNKTDGTSDHPMDH